MKGVSIYIVVVFLMIIACYSCGKEFSCEECLDGNSPPKAVAGPDQVVKLPLDSVLLDGTASSDPNGSIKNYEWRKIAGPATFKIISPNDSITRIRSLISGIYAFELTVTDNGGLSSLDTVQVTLSDSRQTNRPPIANAGPDVNVADSLTLDGSGSTDPDNNITSYQWLKISGPTSFLFSTPKAVSTQVTQLSPGIYLFALKVTDANGLFSSDTVRVMVTAETITGSCDNSLRPTVNVQLLPVTSFTANQGYDDFKNEFIVHGSKIYFLFMECRGATCSTKTRAYYNIYDLNTNTWSKSSQYLMSPRLYIHNTMLVAGNKIFYAGGFRNFNQTYEVYADVDIYDIANDSWSSTSLSEGGYNIAGAVVGNKVMFAGGIREDAAVRPKPSAKVDIYDLSSNTWSVASLSQPRADISAVTSNGKVYFAGGSPDENAHSGLLGASDVIDIYDYASNTWSVSKLDQARTKFTQIAASNKIFWAGGIDAKDNRMSSVESRNLSTQKSILTCLHQESAWLYVKNSSASINNRIFFFPDYDITSDENYTSFDIYDVNTNKWSVGILPISITYASILSYNNELYLVGGFVDGVPSSQIWKLMF